jgi:hypothetical protein
MGEQQERKGTKRLPVVFLKVKYVQNFLKKKNKSKNCELCAPGTCVHPLQRYRYYTRAVFTVVHVHK